MCRTHTCTHKTLAEMLQLKLVARQLCIEIPRFVLMMQNKSSHLVKKKIQLER